MASISKADVAASSSPSPSWSQVAEAQKKVDELSKQVLALPIADLRAIKYRPAALPEDIPQPGIDIDISTIEVPVRDGAKIPLRVYRAKAASANQLPDSDGAVLFFNIHGGGWVLGVPETEEAQNRIIAVRNKAVVVSVDYRKAPEFPFPVPLDDSYDVLQWCRQKENAVSLGVDANKIVIGGGSAGANLTAAITLRARAHDNLSGIVGQILNIPVTCHPQYFPSERYSHLSWSQNAEAPVVDAARMIWFWNHYLSASGVEAAADPSLSPLLASKEALEGLPPALVQVAGMDPLRDEGLAYAEALGASG
ncbi:hypothetical protein A1O3_04177 [Capronia epimyces CBS 606.96]|uniref:Alpha/beta hydrolase fold-3 domain-containing protein n=1 Tax=Capronia epimyces CBS 606.96 TaxID=1182542 RepID=W9Y3X4_9EURO|nr:uncharacterized protein A1O3_04177 [Capronia epimyces CBS 606.96]EXJ87218.1 hypothetical protein A1O3_04177 [Capronia epimyces CBS 606.96]